MIDNTTSKHNAIAVNLAKLTLLAALAPPVIVGIAQRTTTFADGAETAAIVTMAVSLGSVSAIVGALLLGALADIGTPSFRSRWSWVTAATGLGTAGLCLLALSETFWGLIVGWVLAQLGYSGAMAVLRALLAESATTHRRRGAVVAVLGGYGGLVLPVAILLVFPTRIWETTLGLAAMSLAVPVFFLLSNFRFQQRASPRVPYEPHIAQEDQVSAADASHPVPIALLLLLQLAANIVVTVFLTYHPLDLAARSSAEADFPIRGSVLVIAAALVGLVITSSILFGKPAILGNPMRVIVLAGLLLTVSLVCRAVTDQFSVIMLAAGLSGAGVALNSSALFSIALETTRQRTGGKFMGTYSAAGALGQFVGPLVALGILNAAQSLDLLPSDPFGYRTLFLLLSCVPLCWAILIAAIDARASRRDSGQSRKSTQNQSKALQP